MEFAVNYSPALGELIHAGQAHVDRFKCPAWPDLIAKAAALRPVYVHFPLEVGAGLGGPFNSERKQPADLEWLADLLAATGTPLVNTHLLPAAANHPDIPPGSLEPRHVRQVADAALRDLEPLIRRFGAQRVTLENCLGLNHRLLLIGLPEIYHTILEATGCGFLFDQSHARLAASQLGIEERAYTAALPLTRMREMHITGLQVVEGRWLELMQAAGDNDGMAAQMAGQMLDHFPMVAADWTELAWAFEQIRSGAWSKPWVVAYEYGGVGGFFGAITDRDTLLEQVPQMRSIITMEKVK